MVDLAGSLPRAVRILDAFGPDGRELRLVDIAQRTGLAKTTTHRLTTAMTQLRLLERTADGRFRLGGRLFELGMLASVERDLIEVSMPFLQELSERTRETVHLGIREGTEVVYVLKIGGHRQAAMPSRIGGRMPLNCTAIGKVLLAYADRALIDQVLAGPLPRRTPHSITAPGLLGQQLAQIVAQKVAYEQQEAALGVVCIAAPVLDAADRPLAAVSIAGASGRFQPAAHSGALLATAAGIASTLARRAELVRDPPAPS